MNCLAPWLTGWLISQKEEKKYNSTLCAMGIMLQMPRTLTKKTLGYRAFLAAASKLWNGLPPQIQNEPNFNKFKIIQDPDYPNANPGACVCLA